MSKNKKVMSIAIEPELHEELKEHSKRRDMSASAYIGMLVAKAVKISADDEPIVLGKPTDKEVVSVLLNIPASLKGNKEALGEWLDTQVKGIVSKLG